MIDHFIVTRVDLHGSGVADPSRGGFSVRVLDQVLRRSLVRQSCQDFTLLTLWNGAERGWMLDNEVSVRVPRSSTQMLDVSPSIVAVIEERARSPYVLVTRTDSDDAWAQDAVQALQVAATACLMLDLPYYLDAEEIYQLEPGRPLVRRLVADTYVSPFVSVLCRRFDGLDIVDGMMRAHGNVGALAKGMRVPGLRALQVIHGRNVRNQVRQAVASSVEQELFLGEGRLDVA